MSAHSVGGDFGVLIRECLSDYFPYMASCSRLASAVWPSSAQAGDPDSSVKHEDPYTETTFLYRTRNTIKGSSLISRPSTHRSSLNLRVVQPPPYVVACTCVVVSI